jgi:hypothetical protein
VRWVRTWPAKIPKDRAHVVDGLEQIVMNDYNYVPVLEQLDGGGGTVIIEWDLAVSFEDKERFTRICEGHPKVVHVAPYRLYPRSTNLPKPVWAHRDAGRNPPWISEYDSWCDLFSFGLVYLPHAIVREYLASEPETTGDTLFSQWHHRTGHGPVHVHWAVRPVHLHY